MTNSDKLLVVTCVSDDDGKLTSLKKSCAENQLPLTILGNPCTWICNAVKVRLMNDYLQTVPGDQLILFVDAYDVYINDSAETIAAAFKSFQCDVLFSAEANFYFRSDRLQYYYWKYYPRLHQYYNYLNSGSYIGTAGALKTMMSDISTSYNVDLHDDDQLLEIRSDQYLFSRFYVDSYHRGINTSITVRLDHGQELLACTGGRQRVIGWPEISWIHSFVFYRYERVCLKKLHLHECQNSIIDLQFDTKTNRFINVKTKTNPSVIHLPTTKNRFERLIERLKRGRSKQVWNNPLAVATSLIAWIGAGVTTAVCLTMNSRETNPDMIFRFRANRSPEWRSVQAKFVKHLKNSEPFSFIHFNDGELTFIRKYLNGDSTRTWYGRGQHSYDITLGKRLLESIQTRQSNCYIGLPCSSCWPEHRLVAEELTAKVENVVPAMAFHHNLPMIPAVFNLIRDKEIFVVANPHQDFSILRALGIPVSEDRRVNVPFTNSYRMADELQGMVFPPVGVVLLTCGMLAKIILPTWIKRNPQTTFLALGSCLDDLIQRKDSRFRLFPSFLPFTSNVYGGKRFLFGPKRPCSECYNM